MMEPEFEGRRIAREVERAFSDVPYPGDEDLVAHRCPVCAELAEAFRGTRWRDLSTSRISEYHNGLPHFSPPAFRHYLPAYMTAILLHLDESEPLIWDSIFTNVIPPEKPEHMAWFHARMDGLTPAQMAVIRDYVRLYLTEEKHVPEGARERAASFWSL